MLKDNFNTYLNNSIKSNINIRYDKYFENLSDKLEDIPNLILYGPPGSGKYSESLKIIKKYSDSNLKYEKKMLINSSKSEHLIKISDIHYEIDMENLTCNSKILFNDIYKNIVDAIYNTENKKGIILCKNFHFINNEILELFYSYMQKILFNNITIRFILLSEHISFLPKNIIDKSKILYYSKLKLSKLKKISNKSNKIILEKNQDISIDNLNSLKYLDLNNKNVIELEKEICNKIINIIVDIELDLDNDYIINYNNLRNILYDILIYNLNIYKCIEYILITILLKALDNNKNLNLIIDLIIINTYNFLKNYNNNYRPIYHLESYVLYLLKIYNEN